MPGSFFPWILRPRLRGDHFSRPTYNHLSGNSTCDTEMKMAGRQEHVGAEDSSSEKKALLISEHRLSVMGTTWSPVGVS